MLSKTIKRLIVFAIIIVTVVGGILFWNAYNSKSGTRQFDVVQYIKTVDSYDIIDSKVDIPPVYGVDKHGNVKALAWDDVWYSASYVYISAGSIYVAPSAPMVFDDIITVSYKRDQAIQATIHINRPYIQLKDIALSTVGGKDKLTLGVPRKLLVEFVPSNATSKNVQYAVLEGDATVSDDGVVFASADAIVGSVVIVEVRSAPIGGVGYLETDTITSTIELVVARPRAISTPLEFMLIRADIYDDYILTDNIDFGGQAIVPIREFYGTIDGDGYMISNFLLDSTLVVSPQVALIVTNFGRISNITLSWIIMRSDENRVVNIAILCINNHGTIDNIVAVDNKIDILTTRARAGGLVVDNYGTISNSNSASGYLNIVVSSSFGMIAFGNYGTIEFCKVMDMGGTIDFYYATSNRAIGGIVSQNMSTGLIRECVFEGHFATSGGSQVAEIRGYTSIGYIIGINRGGAYVDCKSTGTESLLVESTVYRRYMFAYDKGLVGRNM